MCGFCSAWVCVSVGFVVCGCVYVWVFSCVGVCMYGFCSVWVCIFVGFVMCGYVCGFCSMWVCVGVVL